MSALSPNTPSVVPPMEGIGSLPVKRTPEEEVQFVSCKPVKRLRGSREAPAMPNRLFNQSQVSGAIPTPGKAYPGTPTEGLEPRFPTDQPQQEQSKFNRGVSLPSMENFVFPRPDDGSTTRTSRSSPMLSPKQLPQAEPLRRTSVKTTSAIPTTLSQINEHKPPPWFDASWGSWGLPMQQQMPMTIPMTLSQPVTTSHPQPTAPQPSAPQPSAPQPFAAAQDEKQPPSRPETFTDPGQCSEPVKHLPKEIDGNHAHSNYHHPPQENPEPLQTAQSLGIQRAWYPTQPAPQAPSESIFRAPPSAQIHPGGNQGFGLAAAHSLPPKPPCFACEQMRQQTLNSKVNCYPLLGTESHVHHGQYGSDITQRARAVNMQSVPMSAPGFGANHDMHQSHLHTRLHPMYHGQVPLGYSMAHVSAQVPYPTPMQRAFPVADMSGSDSTQGVPSHKVNHHPQLNMSPLPTTMSQNEPAQCLQGQGARSQPLATPSKSTTASASSPTPLPAHTPRPPTPSSPDMHSPNLIVDIAETCEAIFPWDEIAERHNVPRQKVVDTFAAIIQLPLIRCTTDKKRHGRLATNRLKDFTRGKNATGTSLPAPPATSPACAKLGPNDGQDSERPILPSVLELANSMAPVVFPTALTKKYPGPW